jgi:hypothetical protein
MEVQLQSGEEKLRIETSGRIAQEAKAHVGL